LWQCHVKGKEGYRSQAAGFVVAKVPSGSKSGGHHSIDWESHSKTGPILISAYRDLVVTNSKYVWHSKSKGKEVVSIFVSKLREQQTQTPAVIMDVE
jgi:hypothetical protein